MLNNFPKLKGQPACIYIWLTYLFVRNAQNVYTTISNRFVGHRITSKVTALCSEGPMFRRSHVQKVLCSEGPLFRRFYVQKVLCSEGSIFRRFYVQKVQCLEIFVQKVLCLESTGDYLICQFQLGTQRFCDVESTSMTLIQCCKNAVCPVGFRA